MANDWYSETAKPYEPYTEVRRQQAEAAYTLLRECGVKINPNLAHTWMTPYRLAHYLNYWTRPVVLPRFTTFENGNPVISELVTVGPIDFWACCSHHMLPFFGQVWFGYIPSKTLVGLSMVPLLVKEFCARAWVQETMTTKLADFFENELEPMGLGLVTKAMHTCQFMDMHGPPVPEMMFNILRGKLFSEPRARAEFLGMIGC